MNISFIIPACNEEKYLADCLHSIIKQTRGKKYTIEIIVVNNASTDRTKDIAASFGGVKVIDEPNKGVNRARQRGLQEAQGDFIAYLDADTRMPPHWLGQMERSFNERADLVCLSGPYRYFDGPLYYRTILHTLWNISAPLAYRIVGYTVLGGNFVAKKEALVAIGGFDASIPFYGDDMDIARRLNNIGKVMFSMDFFVYSSSRRFRKEGMVKISYLYTMNFIWQVIFHKSFTKT